MYHAYRSPNWYSYVAYRKADGSLLRGISMVFTEKQDHVKKGWIYLGECESWECGVSISLTEFMFPLNGHIDEQFYMFLKTDDVRPDPGFTDLLYETVKHYYTVPLSQRSPVWRKWRKEEYATFERKPKRPIPLFC